jgi:hypothetical protein
MTCQPKSSRFFVRSLNEGFIDEAALRGACDGLGIPELPDPWGGEVG